MLHLRWRFSWDTALRTSSFTQYQEPRFLVGTTTRSYPGYKKWLSLLGLITEVASLLQNQFDSIGSERLTSFGGIFLSQNVAQLMASRYCRSYMNTGISHSIYFVL